MNKFYHPPHAAPLDKTSSEKVEETVVDYTSKGTFLRQINGYYEILISQGYSHESVSTLVMNVLHALVNTKK